jgi:hypothetical protein
MYNPHSTLIALKTPIHQILQSFKHNLQPSFYINSIKNTPYTQYYNHLNTMYNPHSTLIALKTSLHLILQSFKHNVQPSFYINIIKNTPTPNITII